MLGLYFSGTGNTKHCVETFVKQYNADCVSISIEDPNVLEQISAQDTIVFGYPIYFSNTPKIIKDFINANGTCFKDKQIFIIATMSLFSGDGAGCSARLLKKQGAKILGGLHIKMPDCIGDEKTLKKTTERKRLLIRQADEKIALSVHRMKEGNPTQEGINFLYHISGLFGQRLWFYGKTSSYKQKPIIDNQKCIGCGHCIKLCPMKNLTIEVGKAHSLNRCTMCYRCFSYCPTKALTILGKNIYEQYLFENYQ